MPRKESKYDVIREWSVVRYLRVNSIVYSPLATVHTYLEV